LSSLCFLSPPLCSSCFLALPLILQDFLPPKETLLMFRKRPVITLIHALRSLPAGQGFEFFSFLRRGRFDNREERVSRKFSHLAPLPDNWTSTSSFSDYCPLPATCYRSFPLRPFPSLLWIQLTECSPFLSRRAPPPIVRRCQTRKLHSSHSYFLVFPVFPPPPPF